MNFVGFVDVKISCSTGGGEAVFMGVYVDSVDPGSGGGLAHIR